MPHDQNIHKGKLASHLKRGICKQLPEDFKGSFYSSEGIDMKYYKKDENVAIPIETADSSAVCMRSVAAALQRKFMDPLDLNLPQRMALSVSGLFGCRGVSWVVRQRTRLCGIDPSWADQIKAEDLARWATSLYNGLKGPFDALIIGAPSGGTSHISAALGVPFLSQHFLLSFHDITDPDDILTYFNHGNALAQRILRREPMVTIVNHYDPLHDRYLVHWVNHIRLKLNGLPQSYKDFIYEHLQPGGTIIFTDCRYHWLQYKVGPRHYFQVGGLGGVSDQEFLEGRPEIEVLRGASGGWALPDLSPTLQIESEWGTIPPLKEAVEAFAQRHGYHFLVLQADHPECYARLALAAYRWLNKKEGRKPAATLIEMFTQINPTAPLLSPLLPLWLPFNCTDSLRFLRELRHLIPTDHPVLFTPAPNFARTFDAAEWKDYHDILLGLDVHILGMRKRLFLCDPASLWRPSQELRRWCRKHFTPMESRLTLEELKHLSSGDIDGKVCTILNSESSKGSHLD